MNLIEYWGEQVILTDVDGTVFEGFCSSYTPAEDNPDEKESIDLKIKGQIYTFFKDEIETIKKL
ncbi:MAG: hypothetical protein KHZ78_05450 [Peptoniphilus sp. oral taxon 375]|nr:hypothetical protein [Peptoniphilus sp. oral taxon 375]